MKVGKIFIFGMIFVMLIISMFGGALADTIKDDVYIVEDVPTDNFLGRIHSFVKFYLFNQQTFASTGQDLGCSLTHDGDYKFATKGESITFVVPNGKSAFVEFYRGSPYGSAENRQRISEVYIINPGKNSGVKYYPPSTSWACDAGMFWDEKCYGEIYYCPLPCRENTNCGSGKECDKTGMFSLSYPNFGVCRIGELTHKTKAYDCSAGEKVYLGEFDKTTNKWCSNPNDKMYILSSDANTGPCLSNDPPECVGNGNGDDNGNGNGLPTECIGEEEIFYTKGKVIKSIAFAGFTSYSGPFEGYMEAIKIGLPFVYGEYYTNKDVACCEDFKPIFIEKVEGKKQLGTFGILSSFEYEYLSYKCISKEKMSFCLEFAHSLLEPLTHLDCGTNTLIFIIGGIILLIFISSLMGGKRK